ncbi:MAG: flagellar basal-body rod protein FlgG [Spartobacteria bacterium]|nr:flagellar basal-body rod protein FlgG [Spartobacteria bacterium]
MDRALWAAVTGMNAQELSMDTIANNLANMNTTAFKASQINFQDMLYSVLTSPGAESGDDSEIPTGIQIGNGTRVAEITKEFSQGILKETGRDLDIALEGDGFFEILLPDGTSAYTRDASFHSTSVGEVVTADGYKVQGFDAIDEGTTEITITRDGSMTCIVDGEAIPKADLTLVMFLNPEGLRSIGHNLYLESDSSGAAQKGIAPGENGSGFLAQRYLEGSNVNAAQEMVNMIVTQRAYEATSKAIKACDDMMNTANSLRR